MAVDEIVNGPEEFGIGPAERLARAAGDLRRGLPVVLRSGSSTLLVAAAELAGASVNAVRAAASAAPLVILSHGRAATLKLRLYTPEVAAVPADGLDAAAIRALADPTADLATPLKGPFATVRGPLPPGAEASLDLVRRSGLLPAALIAEAAAAPHGLTVLDAADLNALDTGGLPLQIVAQSKLPTIFAEKGRIVAFRPSDGGPEHLALVLGAPPTHSPVLVRLHSECFTGDLLGSLKCDCGDQLRGALDAIGKAGAGILLYLRQEGRGIGLMNKLKAYALQDQGFDTVEANRRLGFAADERDFRVAAAMLRALGYGEARLMTNNPDKIAGLSAAGIAVVERVPHAFPANPHNADYLATKVKKSGHLL